jgi:hypothetical protein
MIRLLAASEIPDLLPPRDLLPPAFWEQHGTAVLLGAASAGLVVLVALIWLRRRPRVQTIVPPAIIAREALAARRDRTEDTALIGEVSQIVRRYVLDRLKMERIEPTTEELARALAAVRRLAPEVRVALIEFLREGDVCKFACAPGPVPTGLVARAFELIERIETNLAAADPAATAAARA